MDGKVIVLCPLRVEGRRAARAVAGRADVRITGPGPQAMSRALREVTRNPPRLAILFGLAGGLAETDIAPQVARVVDRHGGAWSTGTEGLTILGVDEPATDLDAKRELARLHGAELIDCESHVFAETLEEVGIPWRIVRGVSDGPVDPLPDGADQWIDDRGATRVGRVIRSTLSRPSQAAQLVRLGWQSTRALAAAAQRLPSVIESASATL